MIVEPSAHLEASRIVVLRNVKIHDVELPGVSAVGAEEEEL
jgi:hypothetical protein